MQVSGRLPTLFDAFARKESHESWKGYQPRTNVLNDDKKDDLIADSHSILARWRNHFSQLLNVHELMMLGRRKYTQQNR
jgi:ABC-type enterochelin transport system ATPase subunit